MALIECKNISISYEGPVVVRDLSFAVNRSDFLCIIGENGSGKTTLIKALLGLLRPAAGSISFGDGLKQNQIGYLPQQTGIQRDFPASVTEVVLSGTLSRHRLSPFYTKADKNTARENMAKLGIEALAAKSYRDLSGGQQQRVLLARALCATEQLILLDEPTAGLDPVVTDEMYNIITSLNRDHGITVIMVTHDISAAMKYASHILHLTADTAFFGRTADYAKSDIGRLFSGRAV